MSKHKKVPSYRAEDLREFIRYECNGDLSRLSRKARQNYDKLNAQERVYYYTADETLLEMDSHLRFFEDWLSGQTN